MYEVGSLCTSQCSTCGTLCEAFPISDLSSLQLYATHECVVVVGDLYIHDLPATVTRGALLSTLKTVQYIRGSLYFKNNLFIPAMNFLSNLVGIYGGAHFENNPVLVDARIPKLEILSGEVTVTACDRLCPARYTAVGMNKSDVGCTNMALDYFVHVDGVVLSSQLPLLASVFGRVLNNVTGGEVCVNCRADLNFWNPFGMKRWLCFFEWVV